MKSVDNKTTGTWWAYALSKDACILCCVKVCQVPLYQISKNVYFLHTFLKYCTKLLDFITMKIFIYYENLDFNKLSWLTINKLHFFFRQILAHFHIGFICKLMYSIEEYFRMYIPFPTILQILIHVLYIYIFFLMNFGSW